MSFIDQYRVLPITKQGLDEGFEVLTDPQDKNASPEGWHSQTDRMSAASYRRALSGMDPGTRQKVGYEARMAATRSASILRYPLV